MKIHLTVFTADISRHAEFCDVCFIAQTAINPVIETEQRLFWLNWLINTAE